jgi:transcriptional regulator with XRE-family HTH domain
MSQRTLAKRAGLPQATLSRIESGKVEPAFKTLRKIFNALDCDLSIIPVPRQNLDNLVKQRIHHLAEKHVKYLKGTMALELQQPEDNVLKALIAREEQELSAENSDIWREDGE